MALETPAERSPVVQNYAKAIYALESRSGRPVGTNQLAGRLGVTAGAASAMVKRLAELDLVTHVPYRGVRLTPAGRRVALEVLRHHRLLELFLAETLDLPWDRVHREAELLEHTLSEELEAAISAKLGHPTHDPHGDPIPSAELEIDEPETISLAELDPGAEASFVRVSDGDPALLRHVQELGIRLGMRVRVVERRPFGAPLLIRFGRRTDILPLDVARAMRVQPTP
jgi:DtxR family Mn-dependent transcriptional regulator